jgi:hypothetical protein
MKVCGKCKIPKEESDFGRRTVAKSDGTFALKSYCKSCSNELTKESRIKNNYAITANEKAYRSEFYKKPDQAARIKKYNHQYHTDPDKKETINANRREYSKTTAGIIVGLKKANKRAKKEVTRQKLTEQLNVLLQLLQQSVVTRICTKCKIPKPTDCFRLRHRSKADGSFGLESICKDCKNEISKKYNHETKYWLTEKNKKYQKEYQKTEKFKRLRNQHQLKWLHTEGGKIIQNRSLKKYYATTKGQIKALKSQLKSAKKETTKQRLTEQLNILLQRLTDEEIKSDHV